VLVYPLFHPAAALRTPSVLDRLREDFSRLPELLADVPPELDRPDDGEPELVRSDPASQLDLFA
jgi:DNA polymerase